MRGQGSGLQQHGQLRASRPPPSGWLAVPAATPPPEVAWMCECTPMAGAPAHILGTEMPRATSFSPAGSVRSGASLRQPAGQRSNIGATAAHARCAPSLAAVLWQPRCNPKKNRPSPCCRTNVARLCHHSVVAAHGQRASASGARACSGRRPHGGAACRGAGAGSRTAGAAASGTQASTAQPGCQAAKQHMAGARPGMHACHAWRRRTPDGGDGDQRGGVEARQEAVGCQPELAAAGVAGEHSPAHAAVEQAGQ